MNFLFNLAATSKKLPEPKQLSKTILPSVVNVLIKYSPNSTGFSVVCPVLFLFELDIFIISIGNLSPLLSISLIL